MASAKDPNMQGSLLRSWTGLAKLVLGSKSWSRKTLLRELNVPEFSIVVADIDEDAIPGSTPPALVLAIGLAKAHAILDSKHIEPASDALGKTLLVCGDSVVTHKGQVLGKPRSKEHARATLRSYASAPATTVSSIVVVDVATSRCWAGVGEAEVYFRAMPDSVIDELVENGGSMESAGGLRIEHPLVEKYTECIIGEKSAIMGFPQGLAERLLRNAIADDEGGKPLKEW